MRSVVASADDRMWNCAFTWLVALDAHLMHAVSLGLSFDAGVAVIYFRSSVEDYKIPACPGYLPSNTAVCVDLSVQREPQTENNSKFDCADTWADLHPNMCRQPSVLSLYCLWIYMTAVPAVQVRGLDAAGIGCAEMPKTNLQVATASCMCGRPLPAFACLAVWSSVTVTLRQH